MPTLLVLLRVETGSYHRSRGFSTLVDQLLHTMTTMKAVRFYPPGGPEKLQYENSPVPNHLGPTEMLVKVHAASVIWPELSWPIYQHQKTGEYHPHIPCHDFSGTVVRVGTDVEGQSNIGIGSEVCVFSAPVGSDGLRKFEGAAAEYAVADLDTVVLKPKTLDLAEAATVPLSALTAWQALHEQASLKKGQRLLITGAAGATGYWAVQFAKRLGAYVVGTASSEWSFKVLKELGVDEIIDYKKQDLVENVSNIDLVLDTVGGRVLDEVVKVLKPGGQILSIVTWDVHAQVPEGVKAKFFIVSMKREQLEDIIRLIDEEKLRTFIDSVYPLEKTAEAFRKGEEGHAHGKILISVGS